MSNQYIKDDCSVAIKMVDGTILRGLVNIAGYKRLSDFIDDNNNSIKLYNVSTQGKYIDCLIVPRNNILWFVPLDNS